jgi:hypothetical protein
MATTIHDILFEIRLKAETEREKGTGHTVPGTLLRNITTFF